MDPDLAKSRSRRAFSSFLRALTTYLSPLTLVVGPALALFGVGIDEQWTRWIVFALLVPVAGILWLLNEYRIARHRIVNEGKVQSPEWLWTFLTNRIPHSRQHISAGAQVMVLVPPGKQAESKKLADIYNHSTSTQPLCEGQHNLLFHQVPPSAKPGKEPASEAERLEDLASDLGKCAAVVLLDDGVWKREYASTLKVVEEWSLENTERAVVSLHLNGTGHLVFNWCLFEAVTSDNNQALHSRLLAQATTRGFQWFHQAQIYRWLVLRLALMTLIVSLAALLTTYFLWNWGAKQRQQAQRHESAFNTLVTVAGNGSEQVNIAKTLAIFRNSQKPDWNTRQALLNAMAYQIRAIVERNSGVSEVSVSIFSVGVDKSWLRVDEVGASRPSFTKSPYDFNTDLMSHDQKSIVDCAIVQGAFVFWSGDSKAGTTENIVAWDLQGSEVGKFDKNTKKLDTGQHKCFYQFPSGPMPPQIVSQPGEKDVPQKRLICAPAGSTFNIHEPGNGAICISVPHNVEFLSEPWVRFTLLRFGNALSFSNWERPKEPIPPKIARR